MPPRCTSPNMMEVPVLLAFSLTRTKYDLADVPKGPGPLASWRATVKPSWDGNDGAVLECLSPSDAGTR